MPHHKRAILADIGIQSLNPKKNYKKVSKTGLLSNKEQKNLKKQEPSVEVSQKLSTEDFAAFSDLCKDDNYVENKQVENVIEENLQPVVDLEVKQESKDLKEKNKYKFKKKLEKD